MPHRKQYVRSRGRQAIFPQHEVGQTPGFAPGHAYPQMMQPMVMQGVPPQSLVPVPGHWPGEDDELFADEESDGTETVEPSPVKKRARVLKVRRTEDMEVKKSVHYVGGIEVESYIIYDPFKDVAGMLPTQAATIHQDCRENRFSAKHKGIGGSKTFSRSYGRIRSLEEALDEVIDWCWEREENVRPTFTTLARLAGTPELDRLVAETELSVRYYAK